MRLIHLLFAVSLAVSALVGLSGLIGLQPAVATPAATLQSLIDAAPNGGTVNVAAGTYTESLTVNKTLTLTGVSSATTIIQAVAGQRVITVTAGNNLRLENLTVTGGHPSGAVGGGIIVLNNGSLTLINSRVANNSADYGGGVFQGGSGGRVDAIGSRIDLNTTTYHGGGLYIEGTAAFTNTQVLSNTANQHGGGVHVQYGRADVSGGVFAYNRAVNGNGGAINLNNTLTLSGTHIISNTALNGGGVQQWNAGYAVAITNTRFERNAAQRIGGGAAVSSTLSVNGSLFVSNTVDSGSAQDTWGGGLYAGGASQIAATTFTGNTAFCIYGGSCGNANGGGLYIAYQPLTLTQVTFSRNQAGRMGGGLKTDYATTRLDRVIFSGNYAGWGAGWSHSHGSGALTNGLFNGNVAGWGGGLTVESAVVTLTHVTASGNYASNIGGGLENYWATVKVINSVFWGNTSPHGAQIYDDNSTAPTLVTYSDIQFTGVYTGTGNLNADPRFVQPIAASLNPTTAGNYHVAGNSPVIDLGTNAGVTVDLDGQPRPIGHGYDLGAYESRLTVYLPLLLRY
ncbi:MAG: choice-of-anchor Q domain-containing protein [Anaerolineae bacterium]